MQAAENDALKTVTDAVEERNGKTSGEKSLERRQGMGSRAQEEGLAFETSSIVTKRKEGVTKVAGLRGRGVLW